MSRAKCTEQRAIHNPASRDQTWSRRSGTTLSTFNTQYLVLSTQYGYRRAATQLLIILLSATALLSSTRSAETEPFTTRLATLAARCEQLGLKEQAVATRAWIIPRYPGRQYLFLPAVIDSAAPKPGAPEAASQWHRKFLELRRERAAELFQAAKAASERSEPANAYQLLYEILREDPSHAEARRILGYVKTSSEWKLPEAEKATPRQPPFAHPKLGWPSRGWWRLETAHFEIASNHSAREIAEAGQQLENLHAHWRQIFFRYWSSPKALAARLAGQDEPLSPTRPKMKVVLFKTRQEYAAYVASSHPKAASTLGIYDDKQHIAYFFGGDKSVYPTWYHEGAHQLFQESLAGTSDQPGQAQNFWALEGAALYMESLTEHAGFWTVGGCESDRLQFARYRVRSGDLNLPLVRISALTREAIQTSDDIGRIYTQASGLAHFFLDGADGRYRDQFIDFISALYRGTGNEQTLLTANGLPPEKLDEQYRAFLNVTDDDLSGIPDPTRLKNLSLCRTNVTDSGLSRFAGSKNLSWLDLSFTAASDAGLKHFATNSGLKQLFLEGAKLTDSSLPIIASFKQLEELDLSQLPISDGGLASLFTLRSLKTLYLTSCPVTDEGLLQLRNAKLLEQLDTSGTRVTPDGLRKLKAALPKLK